LHFGCAHEVIPDEAAAEVFRHQEHDALIDGDHVAGHPAVVRVEGIDEAVALPDCLPADAAHLVEGVEAFAWGKGERAAGGAGDDRAVEPVIAADGAAPGDVAAGAVGGGQPPEFERPHWEARGLVGAPLALGEGGIDRVAPVVGVVVVTAAEIEPRVAVLVGEERGAVQEGTAGVVDHGLAAPGVPGVGGEGIGRGAEAEEVHAERLGVAVPAVGQEAALG